MTNLSDKSAVLKHRIKQQLPHVQAKIKYIERTKLEAAARASVDAEVRKKLVAERLEIDSQANHLARHEQARGLSPADTARLAALRKERDELQAEIKKLDDARDAKKNDMPSRDERRVLEVLGRTGGDIFEWLQAQPSGQKYKRVTPELKLRSKQTLQEALEENRAAELDFAGQILIAERSPLDMDAAFSEMRSAVAKLAAPGAPDVSGVFRFTQKSLDDQRKTQGSIRWPVASVTVPTIAKEFQLGSSLLAWLFREQLEARLESEIRAKFDPENCLSVEERAIRIRECSEQILKLQRIREQIILQMEKQGMWGTRKWPCSPLAVLEIEPINSAGSVP